VSWRVIVRPKAEADLREASQWYESRRPNLGSQLLDEISAPLHVLEITPERQPLYYRGFRRIQTLRFHYKIFYRIEASDVIVVRVLHPKRDHRLHL
jgi:toxin ParE1/3/4